MPSLEALAQTAGLSLSPDRWRGRVSGSVRLDGAYGAPVVHGELVGERVGFQNIAWDRVEAAGAWQGAVWEIVKAQAEGPGDLFMVGSGSGLAGGGYELNIEWRDLSARAVADFLDNDLLKRVNLRSNGALRVQQSGGRTGLLGRATVQGGERERAVEASFTVEGDFADGIVLDGEVASGDGKAAALVEWSETESRIYAEFAQFPLQSAAGLLGLAGVGGELTGEVSLEQQPRPRSHGNPSF